MTLLNGILSIVLALTAFILVYWKISNLRKRIKHWKVKYWQAVAKSRKQDDVLRVKGLQINRLEKELEKEHEK